MLHSCWWTISQQFLKVITNYQRNRQIQQLQPVQHPATLYTHGATVYTGQSLLGHTSTYTVEENKTSTLNRPPYSAWNTFSLSQLCTVNLNTHNIAYPTFLKNLNVFSSIFNVCNMTPTLSFYDFTNMGYIEIYNKKSELNS